jgi:hypothetical protein
MMKNVNLGKFIHDTTIRAVRFGETMRFEKTKHRYIYTSPHSVNREEITSHIFMTDYMRELVGEFGEYIHYDSCLHGHDFGWEHSRECNCPIKKPYLKKGVFRLHHLVNGCDSMRVCIPRWKALEILNDWNRNHARECAEQNRTIRWTYFLLDGLQIPKPEIDLFSGLYKDENDLYDAAGPVVNAYEADTEKHNG